MFRRGQPDAASHYSATSGLAARPRGSGEGTENQRRRFALAPRPSNSSDRLRPGGPRRTGDCGGVWVRPVTLSRPRRGSIDASPRQALVCGEICIQLRRDRGARPTWRRAAKLPHFCLLFLVGRGRGYTGDHGPKPCLVSCGRLREAVELDLISFLFDSCGSYV